MINIDFTRNVCKYIAYIWLDKIPRNILSSNIFVNYKSIGQKI